MSFAVVAEAEQSARRSLDHEAYARYLPLVRRTAMRLARRVPSTIAVADLVGYGWVGLMEAYQRSDPNMPEEEFEAYALYRVRGAMLDYMRSLDPSTRAVRRASRGMARAIRVLSTRLGREPDENEIAAELELTVEAYRATLDKIAAAGMARLELLDLDDLDVVAAGATAEDEAGKRQMADAVATAINGLPERLAQILALYYQENCTLRQIGLILGVTESRVSQLHTEAIHRLRAAIGRE